jgi:hypothetical protein
MEDITNRINSSSNQLIDEIYFLKGANYYELRYH